MKVCKFGGTSLADAKAIMQVKEIVYDNTNTKFVVVSAPGKRNNHDTKVTDLLIELSKKNNNTKKNILQKVKTRYNDIAKELGIDIDFDNFFEQFEKDIFSHASYDYVVSRGEFLMAKMFSEYFHFTFVDAKDIIFFQNGSNEINIIKTKEAIEELARKNDKFVVPGFYGSLNSDIKIFERGGSDLTGAIIAGVLNAEEYDNYTDVDGLFVADPKIIESPKMLEKISQSHIRSMTYNGANVLQKDTLDFCIDVPIRILNTFNKNSRGTLIYDFESYESNNPYGVCGISSKQELFECKLSFVDRKDMCKFLGSNDIDFVYMFCGKDEITYYMDIDKAEDFLFFCKKNNLIQEVCVKKLSSVAVVFYDCINNFWEQLQLKKYDINNCIHISKNTLLFVLNQKSYQPFVRELYDFVFVK